jgi:hypothetical protein
VVKLVSVSSFSSRGCSDDDLATAVVVDTWTLKTDEMDWVRLHRALAPKHTRVRALPPGGLPCCEHVRWWPVRVEGKGPPTSLTRDRAQGRNDSTDVCIGCSERQKKQVRENSVHA